MRREEGFCYLSGMTGHFAGAGEEVKVFISGDGWWYLSGKSGMDGVGATAMAIWLQQRGKPASEATE